MICEANCLSGSVTSNDRHPECELIADNKIIRKSFTEFQAPRTNNKCKSSLALYLDPPLYSKHIVMETALEVLSRAATMVNTNSDNRLTINKELPTTKWRRDRRIRLSSEYHHNNHEPVGTVKPLGESNQSNSLSDTSMEIPLDMSVGGPKPLPPPPYRDPLPGTTFCTMSRPSVITQAPKREITSNQENKETPKKPIVMCDDISPATESISMVDPVIDEHFRRSLGADYMNLFGKRLNQLKSPSSVPTTVVRKSAQLSPAALSNASSMESCTRSPPEYRSDENGPAAGTATDQVAAVVATENVEMSVDDHFAKALGDTWKQLQQNKSRASPIESDHDSDVHCDSVANSNTKQDTKDHNDARLSPKTVATNDDSTES